MKRKTKILISVAVVMALLFSAVILYYFGATYPEFDSMSQISFKIPGLDTSFVPQGLEYDAENDRFFVSGYMSNGESSRVYVLSGENYESTKYFTITISGEDYIGHAGGITIYGDNIWVAGDKKVHRLDYSDAMALNNGDSIEALDTFVPGNGADFILTYEDKLIIGEFYKKDKYDTNEEHHVVISEAEKNYAMSYVYTINTNSMYGLEFAEPIAGISMPNQVQGMTVTADGDVVLSTSYSIPDSKIFVYSQESLSSQDDVVTIGGNEIPVYILSQSKLQKTITAPAMSEELVCVDSKVYLLFESNCSKYRMVNRTRISNVYIINL